MKFIEYKLDKIRKFRMSLASQKRIEEHFKCSFARINHDNLKIEDVVYMLWACLEQKDRDSFTPEQLFELLDETMTIKEVYELFTMITEEAFGKNEIPPEVETGDPEENGTGTQQFKTLSDPA